MEYNKDMKPTIAIIIGILLIAGFGFGIIWYFLNEFFDLAIKLSGGV
jgi:hypothetical protein